MKKKTPAQLKKELWKWFTQYVKLRDNNICVTCGKKVFGYEAQGGHYIAKGACGLNYYFSELNTHCQCSNCNLRLEGNRPAYREFIIRKYGQETLKDLEQNYWRPVKDYPFGEKIAYYKAKVEELNSTTQI